VEVTLVKPTQTERQVVGDVLEDRGQAVSTDPPDQTMEDRADEGQRTADPLIPRLEVPTRARPQDDPDPDVVPAHDLVETAPLGTACPQSVPLFQELTTTLSRRGLRHDMRSQSRASVLGTHGRRGLIHASLPCPKSRLVFSPIFIHLPANHFLPQTGKPCDARAMTGVQDGIVD